jgi:phosphoribosylglycinamide formyltransferase-1
MVALANAVRSGQIPNAEIAVVISDRPQALGLQLATELGLETAIIQRRGRTRAEHEQDILSVLTTYGVELICLAGFMRLLSPEFVAAYSGRILNIHPSLLPAFPGLDAQRQAIEHGVKWSGCTVHFVDETLDSGPIIVQRVVPVHDDDTTATLAARILAQEHCAYPEAVSLIVSGNYRVTGRHVTRLDVAISHEKIKPN